MRHAKAVSSRFDATHLLPVCDAPNMGARADLTGNLHRNWSAKRSPTQTLSAIFKGDPQA
jgi:hypothetical protein